MDALAAFGGDFDALVARLDPAVVLRSDFGGRRPRPPQDHPWRSSRCQSGTFGPHPPGAELHPALVNG